MAIKKIDDIYIDGRNRAWGGYIYSLNYDLSFGEAPSEVVVEVTNESGSFDIDKRDLSSIGSPSTIRIGSNITFYGYPMEFSIENSPSGKTLRVSYWDESIAYLDKQVVKLKTRGESSESYVNTIIIGAERTRNAPLSQGVFDLVYSDEGFEDNTLLVPDVDYTFGDLLGAISSYVDAIPELDASASSYRRDYSGKLREVLSAWCNDLGFGFYWENRKLNFVDLRNPANLSSVESYANSIFSLNNVGSRNYGYSIKDTFTKGVEVFFGKDGEVLPNIGETKERLYSFNNIRLRNVTSSFYSNMFQGESESQFINRIKAAYYGPSAFLVNLMAQKPVNSSALEGFASVSDEIDGSSATIESVTNGTSVYTNRSSYKWKKVTMGVSAPFENAFKMYESYAKFIGRFFWKKFPTLERAQTIFGQEGRFYDEWIGIKDVDIFKDYLEPLSKHIDNYDSLSLRGWIEGTGELTSAAPSDGNFTVAREGYLIMETQPEWSPKDNDLTLDMGRYVIIEGSDSDANFNEGTGKDRKPAFYFGFADSVESKSDNVKFPSESPLKVRAQNNGSVAFTAEGNSPRIMYTSYSPPVSANVGFYDFSSTTLSEEQVLGASAFYYDDEEESLSAFNKAASDLILSVNKSQTEPFYSDTLTIPNINLEGASPSIGLGLLSLSISISSNGVQSVYKFGTEKMKIRNSDIFYRYYYDSARKKIETREVWVSSIRKGSANRSYQG